MGRFNRDRDKFDRDFRIMSTFVNIFMGTIFLIVFSVFAFGGYTLLTKGPEELYRYIPPVKIEITQKGDNNE